MKKITLLFFVLIFGCAINYSFAQEDEDDEVEDKKGVENDFPQPTTNVSKFLNDGRKTMAGNAIKFDLTGLIGGNLGLFYERRLNRSLSAEATAGLTLFNGLNYINISNSYGSFDGQYGSLSGNYFGAGIKWYRRRVAIDYGVSRGLQFYHRNMLFEKNGDVPETKMSVNVIRYVVGGQFLVGKRVAMELGWWVGGYFSKVSEAKTEFSPAQTYNSGGPDGGYFYRVGIFF
jgi:hypothetical protein